MKTEINPLFYISVAVAVLVIPIRWLIAWVIATLVHEGFHLLALRLVGCRIYSIQINPQGAVICTAPIQQWKELFCAIVGPIGSFCLLFLTKWMPLTALCGCLQGLYNLLPLYPMDGGRVVNVLLQASLTERQAGRVLQIIRRIVFAGLINFALYCMIRLSLGLLPLILVLTLIMKTRKIPCKSVTKGVQYC